MDDILGQFAVCTENLQDLHLNTKDKDLPVNVRENIREAKESLTNAIIELRTGRSLQYKKNSSPTR